MLTKINAPFSSELVGSLHRVQAINPVCCARRDEGGHPPNAVLVVGIAGYSCDYCDYVRTWAHDPRAMLEHHESMVRMIESCSKAAS